MSVCDGQQEVHLPFRWFDQRSTSRKIPRGISLHQIDREDLKREKEREREREREKERERERKRGGKPPKAKKEEEGVVCTWVVLIRRLDEDSQHHTLASVPTIPCILRV